ncbi:MAG: hypothetical protein H6822_33130 [Planctomycetaceae bacterium]|nr:hypothetical protein [Planctomycetaceae bacterium]
MAAKNDVPELEVINVVIGDDVMCKRPDQGIWMWQSRIYVPCPLALKNVFIRFARANHMSQAELGLVILQDAMNAAEATQDVVNEYRRNGKGYDRNGVKR